MIRYFIYQSHYSNPIDYSDGALEAAGSGWERMMTAVRFTRDKLRHPVAGVSPDAASIFLPVLEDYKAKFIEAMDDDFNAPNAIAILQSLTTEVNKLLNSAQPVGVEVLKAINDHYLELGGKVLGIVPEAESTSGADAARLEGVVRMLIEMRAQARKEKQFARADQIRDQLKDLGIVLEDRADGTFFRVE